MPREGCVHVVERDGFGKWKTLRRGTSGGVANLVGLGAVHGMGSAECLRGSGLNPENLQNESASILAEQELVVIANIVRHLGDKPGLGVEAGRRVTLGNLGIFGYALMCSATLADALDVAARFASLTNTFSDLSVVRADRSLELVCTFVDLDTDVRAFILERDMAVIAGVVPMLLGNAVLPRVEVELDESRGALLAQVLPAEELICGAGRTALIVPQTWGSRRLPHADPETARHCVAQCQELLEQRRLGVRSLVWSLLHQRNDLGCSLADVAEELHVDRRTLQRWLAREGTSFRALLDEVRRMRAVHLLTTTSQSVGEVAALLGYGEPASLTHAFARWHGTTPIRFRSMHR